jgi:hypothetical protein
VNGQGPKGVRNANGALLDGKDTGDPGSDYHLSLTWKELVLGDVSIGFLIRYHILKPRSILVAKVEHPHRAPAGAMFRVRH